MSIKNEGEGLILDPKQFPKRIELELPEEVFEAMQKAADETGRSISEIATDILSRATKDPHTTD
jgi:hypothetical protein